jgi:hypothetical protein
VEQFWNLRMPALGPISGDGSNMENAAELPSSQTLIGNGVACGPSQRMFFPLSWLLVCLLETAVATQDFRRDPPWHSTRLSDRVDVGHPVSAF